MAKPPMKKTTSDRTPSTTQTRRDDVKRRVLRVRQIIDGRTVYVSRQKRGETATA